MSHSHFIKIITPATPGLLTRLEHAEYLAVDDGTITGIAQRFFPPPRHPHCEGPTWSKEGD